MSKSIRIYTMRGGDIGEGHHSRMSRLTDELRRQGSGRTELFVNEKPFGVTLRRPDVFVFDFPDTDPSDLKYIRMQYPDSRIVIVVGNGWTITPEVHGLADVILYQDPRNFERKGTASVLSGLKWLMVDTTDFEPWAHPMRAFVYLGAESTVEYAEQLCSKMTEAGVNVFQATKHDYGLPGKPWSYGWETNPAELLRTASLYVGTMGMTAWDALALRVPCYLVNRGPEHYQIAAWIEAAGWGTNFGMLGSAPADHIAYAAANRLRRGWQPHERASRSELRGLDGKGLERVAEMLMGL